VNRSPASGFTLIELVMTVAIIGLLATAAVPMAELAVQRHKEQSLRIALREIRTALDAYRQAAEDGRIQNARNLSGYPPSLDALVAGAPDVRSPDGKARIYFLRRVPRDPFFNDATVPDEETWGRRSYTSSAESPEQGDDVFDVYSTASGVGLNGIPYRRW
jgi:general secretion pathway protein G